MMRDTAARDDGGLERRAGGKSIFHRLLPSPGNALFTLIVATGLLAAYVLFPASPPPTTAKTSAATWAAPSAPLVSNQTIAYQGRITDASGIPLNGTYPMTFALYAASAHFQGEVPLWSESYSGGNLVPVSNGLFNVLLGSVNPIPPSVLAATNSLYLGITVGSDVEMTPRVQVVGTSLIADAAVTSRKFKPTTVRLLSSSDLNLTNSFQNIPNLTYSFNPATDSTVIVLLVVDFDATGGSPGGFAAAEVLVDGSPDPATTTLNFTSASTRATVPQTYSFNVTGGAPHTITALARGSLGGTAYQGSATMTVVVVSQ